MAGRSSAVALIVVAATTVACSEDGPLDAEDRAALPGSIYYLEGGDEHGEATSVARLELATGQSTQVTDGRAPAFVYGLDPKGERLALTVADDLVLAAPDGSDPRPLAVSPEIDWYPRFSPDGRHIVFESARGSFRDLYRVEVATGEVTRLTDNPEGNFDAAWSPDGRKLAFASSRAGQLDVWVMDADGSNPVRLTRHAGDSVKPAWSPSGAYIAFISARDGKDDLYVVTPDGATVTKLSEDAPEKGRRWMAPHVERFAWHPTEDRIAYAARAPRGKGHIYLVEVPSGATKRLSGEAHDDREPSWSPDGAYIAFASEVAGGSQIHVMRADGRRRTRLTSAEHRAWLPRWAGATTK